MLIFNRLFLCLLAVMVGSSDGGFSKDVCRSMVAMLDTDKSGKLGFEEFEALLTDIAKWKAVFKNYDEYRTGRIDGFQLRNALNSAGYHLNNRILNALVHRYGGRDGKIAFDDFLMCAVKIKTYMGMLDSFIAPLAPPTSSWNTHFYVLFSL